MKPIWTGRFRGRGKHSLRHLHSEITEPDTSTVRSQSFLRAKACVFLGGYQEGVDVTCSGL